MVKDDDSSQDLDAVADTIAKRKGGSGPGVVRMSALGAASKPTVADPSDSSGSGEDNNASQSLKRGRSVASAVSSVEKWKPLEGGKFKGGQ